MGAKQSKTRPPCWLAGYNKEEHTLILSNDKIKYSCKENN